MTALKLDRDRYFAAHRTSFGALQPDQEEGLDFMLGRIEAEPWLEHLPYPAYMLATSWHETGTRMQPISEWGKLSYFDKYDPVLAPSQELRNRARRMGNTVQGDGYRYRGRGYVQLTWKVNYAKAGKLLGLDLVANPDAALQPDVAWRIMSVGMRDGWFTGKKLADFLAPGREPRYVEARRVINGLDQAGRIARYARLFAECLNQAR